MQAVTMDIVGANLVERVRVLFLRAVLYMEVAWFDQDANAGSILTAHLASAAPAVRGAAGDTLATLARVSSVPYEYHIYWPVRSREQHACDAT